MILDGLTDAASELAEVSAASDQGKTTDKLKVLNLTDDSKPQANKGDIPGDISVRNPAAYDLSKWLRNIVV